MGRFFIVVAAWLALAGGVVPASCSRPAQASREVVVYSGVDDPILRQVTDAFSARTGIRALIVGDTEATKTTGLVERLLAERAAPRCDVWWSSEAMGTIRLSREGLIEPYRSPSESRIAGGWPAGLAGPIADGAPQWYGFACRARVIAFDTRDLKADEAPRTLQALTDPKWNGRVGMARPQFGSTRSQMATLVADCGPGAFREWLGAMKAGGLRLYDGNSAVVRAIAQGEIDVGLTDTDDVWAAQREGWPVGASFEAAVADGAGLCSLGPMLIPNTVALIRGAPHGPEARALIDFLLGEEAERILADSDSHNLPVARDPGPSLSAFAVPGGRLPDLSAAAGHADEALRVCAEVLGTP